MLTFDEIVAIVKPVCTSGEIAVDVNCSPAAIKIHRDDLLPVASILHSNSQLFFDMLSCITGIDNGPTANTMEVAYNFYSIPFNQHLMIKLVIDRTAPVVNSLCAIYKTADWHEREMFDMYGIIVKGHPDLRRILMPADWEGHPLQKDYKQQDYYRNIKLDY
jgi:NADH-quinone oxidoreductase subunit C